MRSKRPIDRALSLECLDGGRDEADAVRTERTDGWLVEAGPNSLLSGDPALTALPGPQGTTASKTNLDYARPSSNHPGGVNACFCDGHLQFISNSIDYEVYKQLMSPDMQALAGPDGILDPPVVKYLLNDRDFR